MKIKIFYHINLESNSAGGIINFLRGLCEKINEDYDLEYISMKYETQSNMLKKSLNTRYLKTISHSPNKKKVLPNNLVYLFYLIKYNYKNRFNSDELLIYNRADHILPGIWFQKKNPKILIVHGSSEFDQIYYSKYSIKKWFALYSEKVAVKKFDNVVLVSEDAYKYYIKQYEPYKSKFIYIPTFVDQTIFDDQSIVKSKKLEFIYVGRFVKEKGMFELKEYIAFLNNQHISARFTIVGEGELEYLFEDYSNVDIINTVKQRDLITLLKGKILLMFSHYEGLPLALIEAMSVGTPAITSSVGGMQYIMHHQNNGYQFNNVLAQFDEIYEASCDIYLNYETYSQNAMDSIVDFTLIEVYSKYRSLFDSLSR